MERAGADLGVVRLDDETPARAPILLQTQDNLLETQRFHEKFAAITGREKECSP
jgi:hypothetical protein